MLMKKELNNDKGESLVKNNKTNSNEPSLLKSSDLMGKMNALKDLIATIYNLLFGRHTNSQPQESDTSLKIKFSEEADMDKIRKEISLKFRYSKRLPSKEQK